MRGLLLLALASAALPPAAGGAGAPPADGCAVAFFHIVCTFGCAEGAALELWAGGGGSGYLACGGTVLACDSSPAMPCARSGVAARAGYGYCEGDALAKACASLPA